MGFAASVNAIPDKQLTKSIDSLWNQSVFDFHEIERYLNKFSTQSPDTSLASLLKIKTEWAIYQARFADAYKGNFLLGVYYFNNHQFNASQKEFEQALKYAPGNEEKGIALYFLAKLKIKQRLFIEALEFLRQAKIQIYNYLLYDLEFEIVLNETYCYIMLSNFEAAKTRLANLKNKQEDFTGQIIRRVHEMEGFFEYRQQHYLQALIALKKVISASENDTISVLYAHSIELIGEIYLIQKNYLDAERYFIESARIFKMLTIIEKQAEVNGLLGELYLKTQQYKKAYRYLQESMVLYGQIDDNYGMCKMYNLLAEFNLETNQLAKVLPVLWKANDLDKFCADNFLFLITNLNFSKYYSQIQKFDSALYFASKAMSYAKKIEQTPKVRETYLILSSIYYNNGDFKEAADALLKAQKLDELQEYLSQTAELKLQQKDLEKLRQEHAIHALTQERNKQDKQLILNQLLLGKQKSIIVLIGIILFFISMVTLFLLFFIVQKRKNERKLEIRNQQIAQQKEEIEVQQQYLLEINQELEKLSIVAKETDNGIKVMNEVGRVVWVNEGYVKMHGFSLDELQTIEHVDLVGDHANIDVSQLVRVWYGDKKPITYESLNKTKWGQEIWVQTTLTPILDSNGRIERMIAIESDITRIKLAEKEIITKNLDITSSIYYAKRIQEAMMTPFHLLTRYFPESFYFLLPKSIVSGDFYWITYRFDRLIVVCADSTGHGVPGAFMSLIGISFLNKIVNEKGYVSPAIILNQLRMSIIDHLHQNNGEQIAGDGLDMSIVSIDIKNRQLEFAGAMNPVIILRNSDIIELKPDRMPVGFFDNEDRPFSSTHLSLQTQDQIFMYTDGYYDQFGGPGSSKMKGQKFRNILKECAQKPAETQIKIIEEQFHQWRGTQPQVDDVLILGIHVN